MAKITVTIEGSQIGTLTVETDEFEDSLGVLMIGAAIAAHPFAADGVTQNTPAQAVAAYVKQHMLTLMQSALRAKGAAAQREYEDAAAALVI